MAGTTDTRIVQMQFDNRDFEKNIAVSQESLEKFKEELDFDEQEDNLREFEAATKRMRFEDMAENLQKLTDKFTGLGTVSELVLSQIRRSIENMASKFTAFVNSMSFDQVSAGKEKFDLLNKSVQTIKSATGETEDTVYKVMKRLNQYTDQTSYNFADMAQNIGKFTSVGIDLESAERQMEGIANWAARSGAGINEASRAMYNLSQAVGMGKMTSRDWVSIENAGMATKEFKEQLIKSALAAGTLVEEVDKASKKVIYKTSEDLGKQEEVTYQNLGQMLSKGIITREVLSSTLERYYWDDLYYTGTEALLKLDAEQKQIFDEMLADNNISLNDWKALKDWGMATDELKQKLLDLAVTQGKLTKETDEDGKVVYKTLEKNGKELKFTLDQFEESLKTGWFDKNMGESATTINEFAKECYEAAQKCLSFSDVIGAWKDQISTGFMQSFQHIFGNLTESMEMFSAVCNKVGESLGELIGMINGYEDEEGHHAGILEEWAGRGGRDSLWGLFIGEYDGLYEGAVGILDIFTKVTEMVSDGFWQMIRLTNPASLLDEAFNEKWDMNEEYRQQYLAEKLLDITEGMQSFFQSIKDFLNGIPEGATKSRFEMIQDVVNGIAGALLLAYTVGKKVFGFLGKLAEKLAPSADAIAGLMSRLGLGMQDAAHAASTGKGLDNFFGDLLDKLTPLTDAINNFITLIADLLGRVLEKGTKNGTFGKILKFLGDLLSILVDIISRVAGPVIDFAGEVIDAISGLFDEGINAESMKKFANSISNSINNLFEGVLEGIFGSDAGKKINEFFGYLFGFDEDDADDEATTAVGAIKKWVKKIFGLIGGIFDGLKNEDGELTLFGLLKANLFSGGAGKFIKDLTQIFSGSNIYKLTKAFGGLLTLFKLFQTLSKAKTMFKTVGSFFGGLSTSLKEGFKLDVSDKTEQTGDKILKIAKGIALIAAAVMILGSMKISALAKGVGAVAVIMGLMIGFMFVMKKIITGMGLAEIISITASIGLMGLALTGIIIAMSLLILALKPLAKMSMTEIASLLTGFVGIVLILGMFCKYVANTMKENTSVKGMFSLALMALGMGMLIKRLIPLSKLNLEQIMVMLIGFGGILAELYFFAKYMNGESFKDKGMWALIGLAAGMALLMLTLKPIAMMNLEQIIHMLTGFGGVLLLLAMFAKGMKDESFSKKGLFSVIILAAGLVVLMEAIKPLAAFSWEGLLKMGVGLAGVLLMLKMFNQGLGSYRFTEMAGMIAVAVSIKMLIKALMPLTTVDWAGLLKMGVGLAGVLLMMHIFMESFEGMKIRDAIGGFVAMAGIAIVLLAFGASMNMMKEVKWSTMIVATISLIALIIVYMAMVDMINNNEKSLLKGLHAMVAMIGLAAVMLVFAMALNEIKNVKTEKILVFSLGLAALIIGVAAALKLLEGITLLGALKGILILGVAVAALMAVMALILPLVIGSIGTSIEQLSAKLTIIGNLFTQFIANMSNFTEEEVRSAERKFNAFFDLVKSLKDVSQYMQPLMDFVFMMQELGAALELYSTLTRNIGDPKDSNAVKLIEKILGLKDKINDFNMGGFTQALQDLGSGLGGFVSPVTGGSVTTSEPEALKLLQNILGCRDEIDEFSKLDLTGFTEILQGLGGALSLYAMGAKEVTGLTEDELGVDGVAGAVQLMTSISKSLNEGGGFKIPDIPTEGEIGLFPSNLAALANAMVKFANACEAFEEGKTKNALASLAFLGDLNEQLTEDKLKVINRTVDVNYSVMSRFGMDIRSLGGALYDFYEATKDFGDTTNAMNALTFFKQLGTDLTEDALLATTYFDTQNVHATQLGQFSNDITALGGALQSFANNTKFEKNTKTTFDNALAALDDLVEMRNKMPNIGGVVSWFEGNKQSFSDLADDITVMGGGLAELSKSLKGAVGEGQAGMEYDAELVNSALSALSSMVDMISILSTIPEGRIYEIGIYGIRLADFVDFLVNTTEVFEKGEGGYIPIGTFAQNFAEMMSQVSGAIESINKDEEKAKIDKESINMFSQFAKGLADMVAMGQIADFESIGLNIAKGVATGLRSQDADTAVTEAAQAMIIRIQQAAEDQAVIKSPSQLFRDSIGKYIALGMAQGIHDYSRDPAEEAEEMVDRTVTGSMGALALLSKLLSENLDTTPTIRPVLDLTDVEAGATRMNGLFGGSYGLSLTGGTLTIDPTRATLFANEHMPNDYTESISQVNREIGLLRDDVQNLAMAMKNIRLVMNTGAVVGAIGPEMDQYLGQRGFYSSRTDV